MNKKLFLLDAYALIYRAYYAFIKNPRINSKGLNTSAIFGFVNTLWNVLQTENPTHIAVVFDAGVTGRDLILTDYKANREKTPEDIKTAEPYIRQIIEAFNIPVLQAEGYEADDVIGTLAKKAEEKGFVTYMMTPDKDFGQLVSENIFMYKPPKGGNNAEIWGVKEVCEKFQIQRPEQVIDILGLMGDAVDNIPGVPGVGEKTAMKLVGEFGSVEGVLENSAQLKGKLKERVEENQEQALISKQLATIVLDAPVDLDEKSLKAGEFDREKLEALFAELEFRGMGKRIFGEDISVTAKPKSGQMDLFGQAEENGQEKQEQVVSFKTIENTKHKYHFVDTEEKRADLIKQLLAQKSICFDTETTSLDELTAELVGMSFAFKSGEAYWVPVPENREEATVVAQEFKTVFENDKIEKSAQNIKYDMLVLRNYSINVQGPMFDTMLAHYLIQPDMRHNMDILAETYLNYRPISIETLIGKKGKNQLSMRQLEPEQITDYAAEDADITLQLKELFEPQVKEGHLEKLFYQIEMPLTEVLADMEEEGIKLDVETMKEFSKELAHDIAKLQRVITELAEGEEFNLDSPRQLGLILFEKLKISDKPKKTKTGQYSTSEDELQKLANSHPIIPKILDYRSVRKLKSTYVDPLPEMVNTNTGHIHTSYMQAVAATGRLSSNSPNLQNIPIRTERGREIRKAFVPRNNDYVLLSADYSQVELRIIAALSGDENMQAAFINKEDIHTATAAKVFDVNTEEVTREMRSKAKAVNFGIIYGQSAFGLAQGLGISRTEARQIIDNYFSQYPRIKEYMDKNIEFARKHEYVETIMGRRRYLRDINSANNVVKGHAERNAINAPIQGSAADIIKIAMLNIHKELSFGKFQSKMLLQVHDELVFDVHKSELEKATQLVKNKMETAVELSVPLLVETGIGSNWLEAH
ncbi:MAG: DNA polymerase I [Flavobacteriales bacterium]|nr:MAG: DNA polymerase I [Flavobacteriales bacterium]